MKLIVGLGNPGKSYEKTRHNVGFMVLDKLIQDLNLKTQTKFKGEFTQTTLNGESVVLLKPHTFMNLSGESVRLVKDFYKIEDPDILVIYDDLDLPVGKLRLREKGSSGGHNGIKSIISHLHHQDFKRIRIGIDKDPLIVTADYVLGKFSKNDQIPLKTAIDKASQACQDFCTQNFVDVMTRYNTSE